MHTLMVECLVYERYGAHAAADDEPYRSLSDIEQQMAS